MHLAPRGAGELHEHARAVQAGERGVSRGSEALAALSRPREGAPARVEAWAVTLGGRVAGVSPRGDVLRAHWVGFPEDGRSPSGAEASPQAPRVATARSLLQGSSYEAERAALLREGVVPTQ